MNHFAAQEDASAPVSTRRVNFRDGNRDRHVQVFFTWLPEEFHETPHVDWTRLPSRVMGYLVRTVGESPFAIPLALAATAGYGAMNEVGLLNHLTAVHLLLRDVQARCGVQNVAELTSQTWSTYAAAKEFAAKDFGYVKRYAVFTETHIPEYLEKLTPQQYAQVEPHILPRLPRRFRQQYVPASVLFDGQKQRRKAKTDLIAPLHTLHDQPRSPNALRHPLGKTARRVAL